MNEWLCEVCGLELESGEYLDCVWCRAWLNDELDKARTRLFGLTAADVAKRLERIWR